MDKSNPSIGNAVKGRGAKMKLLLSGGGDPECVVHMDEFFVDGYCE